MNLNNSKIDRSQRERGAGQTDRLYTDDRSTVPNVMLTVNLGCNRCGRLFLGFLTQD